MKRGKTNGVARDSLIILHAEDSPDCVALVRRALKLAGFNPPIWAKDGQFAIEHLAAADEENRPQVILLDLNMPLKDGFQVLEWLRSQPAYESTPVLMLTSSQEAKDVERANRLGATKYLPKDGTYRQVVETLEELLAEWNSPDA